MKKNSINQVPPNIWNEPYTTLTKEDLQRRFKEYNEQYFDNVLPPCRMSLTASKGATAFYVPSKQYGSIITFCKYAYWTDTLLKLVMIHEMCHQYVDKIYNPQYFTFAHGRLFNKVCKMLREKYNLRVKHSELPVVYFYKEKISTTFLGKLLRKYWGPKF